MYNLGQFVSGKASYLYANARSSSVIHQGVNQPNMIAVDVKGNSINLYVNGQSIDSPQRDALTRSTFKQGQIGLFASDLTTRTSVIYSNALVWTAP